MKSDTRITTLWGSSSAVRAAILYIVGRVFDSHLPYHERETL